MVLYAVAERAKEAALGRRQGGDAENIDSFARRATARER